MTGACLTRHDHGNARERAGLLASRQLMRQLGDGQSRRGRALLMAAINANHPGGPHASHQPAPPHRPRQRARLLPGPAGQCVDQRRHQPRGTAAGPAVIAGPRRGGAAAG